MRNVGYTPLTDRELDVLRLVAEGFKDAEIAKKLNISPSTVKTHVSRIIEKMNARTRTDAAVKARTAGII